MSAHKTKPFGRQRRDAKELLKLVRAGDSAAIERAQKHLHHFDPTRFSLMTAQFLIAREKGFQSWGAMLASGKEEA